MRYFLSLIILLIIPGCSNDPLDYEVTILINGEEFKCEDASYFGGFNLARASEETEYGWHEVTLSFADDISLGIHALEFQGDSVGVRYFQNTTTLITSYSQVDGTLNLLENSETRLRGTFDVDLVLNVNASSPEIDYKLTEGRFNIAK